MDGSAPGRLPGYRGEYEITPAVGEDIVLPTAGKSVMRDITVLAVPKMYPGEGGTLLKTQVKTAVPAAQAQSVVPDEGFDLLEQVDIQAIPYSEQLNEAGGTTVTIG